MRIAVPCLALLPGIALAYGEHPPAGHAGGFGEPDCGACHAAAGAPAGDPELAVRGLPDRYRPGAAYEVTFVLAAPGMNAGGMMATARDAAGAQAGRWRPSNGLEVTAGDGVAYLRQARPHRGSRATWRAEWRAPSDCAGPVQFHVAGNAANEDDSEFGDRVITTFIRVSAPAGCRE